MYEESVSLEDVTGFQDVSFLEDMLASAANHPQRIALIEQFLLSKLKHDQYKPDLLVLHALESIQLAKGVVKIKELADTHCISLDAFEKRFRRAVGVSPKQFSYIIRMKSVVQRGLTGKSLADMAFEAGYFDQPHFNKDFKLFTGQAPTDFLKSPVFW